MQTPDKVVPLAHPVLEACRRLGIGRTMMYELIKSEEIRTIKIGARVLIPEVELQKVIDSRLATVASSTSA